jgi:hypothetical protein
LIQVCKLLYRIPSAIKNYFNDNIRYPVGIIGCRATNPEMSLDCCEYDLAIFSGLSTSRRILNIDNHMVELINMPAMPKGTILALALKDMILLSENSDNFILSSPSKTSNPENYRRMLTALGKKAIIASLFHYEKINKTIEKQPLLAAMWMKISAYDFLEGILALAGTKPMPLHELSQVRQITFERQDIADGVKAALECIGLERATRSVIARSLEGVLELNSNEYDRELISIKIKYLLEKSMLSDCYYYIGRIGYRSLIGKSEKFLAQYIKLVQISMDLTKDVQQIQKLHNYLFKTSKNVLKLTHN